MYFSVIALISQGVPQLGGVKQRWDGIGKTSLRTHTAVARLPGVSYMPSCEIACIN